MQISSFGSSIITLSAAAAIVLWLIAGRAWRMALWWCGLFALGLMLVMVTKVAFLGWGVGSGTLNFAGISGHSMRAAAVFPVIFYLALQKSPPSVRTSGVLLGLAIGVLIGVARVMLHAHSVSDVVAGWLLGGAVSIGFIRLSKRLPKPLLNHWLIGLSLLALLPTAYAEPVSTNQWMNAVALYLSGHDKPFVRAIGESF
jgi:membrane-associated phospholipid phosphatase